MSSSKTRTTGGKGTVATGKTPSKPTRARTPRIPPPPNARSTPADVAQTTATGASAQHASSETADVEGPGAQPMNKRELLNKVVARADVKKKFAKPTVEAVLAILGETLAEGREMNLQPLGKVKLNRTQDSEKARVIVTKIRQNKAATGEAPKPDTATPADAATDAAKGTAENATETSTETED